MIYISSNETTTTKRAFIASKSVPGHNFSVCDDGCFAFVDVGGSVQRLKYQQDYLSIFVDVGGSVQLWKCQQDHLSIFVDVGGSVQLPSR